MLAKKKCKGSHKYTYGLGCGELVAAKEREYGLGSSCGCFKAWLQSDRSKEYFQKRLIPKAKINIRKAKKEERRKIRAEKSLQADWSKRLQDEINRIARTIDKGLPCLARNIRGQMHAGHVFARGGNQTIRLNLHNIHRQSAQSNHFQNDDGKLREGVVNEYGYDYMEFISGLRRTPALTYNNREYRDLTEKARKILKRLKEADRIYTKSERIEMRNRINVELGIYDREFCEYEVKTIPREVRS